jgi:hypothetical protein
MAFTDPQSVTISGTAVSLPLTGRAIGAGIYASNDGNTILDIRHSNGNRIRRTIGITAQKLVSDPLRPSDNKPVKATVRVVVDTPVQGFTPADLEAILVGFFGNLTASTNANMKKFLGGES